MSKYTYTYTHIPIYTHTHIHIYMYTCTLITSSEEIERYFTSLISSVNHLRTMYFVTMPINLFWLIGLM